MSSATDTNPGSTSVTIPTGQNSTGKEQKIRLEIIPHEYKFMANRFQLFKKTIGELKIGNIIKDDLVRDINIITSILSKSEVH